MDIPYYISSKENDKEFRRIASCVRRITKTEATVTLLQMDNRVLPSTQASTLIVLQTGNHEAEIERARGTTRQAQDVIFIQLPGDEYLPWLGDQNLMRDDIQELPTVEHTQPDITRFVTTILFTDIVESTRLAHDIGDAGWKMLLEKHDSLCKQKIQQFRGKLVKNTGDGVHATFDGPGRGITCAKEIINDARAIGLSIRAGLHTGECEIWGDQVEGIAVHLAARVAALASPEQVLVTRTIRDLVSGSGIGLEDYGTHTLKGFSEAWQIFAA